MPQAGRNVLKCLSSNTVGNVNPGVTSAVFQGFKLRALRVVRGGPRRLLGVHKVSRGGLTTVIRSCKGGRIFQRLVAFLTPFGMAPGGIGVVLGGFKGRSISVVQRHPCVLDTIGNFKFLAISTVKERYYYTLGSPVQVSKYVKRVVGRTVGRKRLFGRHRRIVERTLRVLGQSLRIVTMSRRSIDRILCQLILRGDVIIRRRQVCSVQRCRRRARATSVVTEQLLRGPILLSVRPRLRGTRGALKVVLSRARGRTIQVIFTRPVDVVAKNPKAKGAAILGIVLCVRRTLYESRMRLVTPAKHTTEHVIRDANYRGTSAVRLTLKLLKSSASFRPSFRCLSTKFLGMSRISVISVRLTCRFFQQIDERTEILLIKSGGRLPSMKTKSIFQRLVTYKLVPIAMLSLICQRNTLDDVPCGTGLVRRGGAGLDFKRSFRFVTYGKTSRTTRVIQEVCLSRVTGGNVSRMRVLAPCQGHDTTKISRLGGSLRSFMGPPVTKGGRLRVNDRIFQINSGVLRGGGARVTDGNSLNEVLSYVASRSKGTETIVKFPSKQRIRCRTSRVRVVRRTGTAAVRGTRNSRYPIIVVP